MNLQLVLNNIREPVKALKPYHIFMPFTIPQQQESSTTTTTSTIYSTGQFKVYTKSSTSLYAPKYDSNHAFDFLQLTDQFKQPTINPRCTYKTSITSQEYPFTSSHKPLIKPNQVNLMALEIDITSQELLRYLQTEKLGFRIKLEYDKYELRVITMTWVFKSRADSEKPSLVVNNIRNREGWFLMDQMQEGYDQIVGYVDVHTPYEKTVQDMRVVMLKRYNN